MLAIFACLREWRVYLEGAQHQTIIYTDHKNLAHFTTTKQLNRRQARWSELLGNYDFVIVYHPGPANGKANALSRRPDHMANAKTKELRSSLSQALIKLQQWSVAATGLAMFSIDDIPAGYHQRLLNDYQRDFYCKKLLAKLASTALSADSFVKNFSKSPNSLILLNNLVFVLYRSKVKLNILRDCHDSPTSGHQGQVKTLELVNRSYYWPSLCSTVDNYVCTCEACNRSKSARHKPYGQLQPLPLPDRPWKSISMDFIVKLPPSSDASSQTKYDSIWVIVDKFTKMTHFVPCREAMHASNLAKLFIQHIFAQHGLPEEIISDRGSLSTSSFIKSLCQLAKVDQRLSTAYHPQTNG